MATTPTGSAAYRLFKRDPYHPSLHFKKLRDRVYSARIGRQYRVLGIAHGSDHIVWYWIGHHTDYDKLIKRY